ncbi:MAG: alpha-amylase, partial [Actinobacteria bacterium]|nr:alpha-amylase [Actinomycetota bacterium]
MSVTDSAPRQWWRDAVVYQIYPRSFHDANNDGEGDLAGVTARIDYIDSLGVDAIWLNPCYRSPMRDGGYDVADYRDIDPRFGTLADFDTLLSACHARGIRVIMDLVPNHCSSEHPWFQQALTTAPGSDAWARFHCVHGRGDHGQLPPNNWQSVFSGPAWSEVRDVDGGPTGYWYLHLFDPTQPDLNWEHPQ